jgi:hypothetical protein
MWCFRHLASGLALPAISVLSPKYVYISPLVSWLFFKARPACNASAAADASGATSVS